MRRVSLPSLVSANHNFASPRNSPARDIGGPGDYRSLVRLKPVDRRVSILERPTHIDGDREGGGGGLNRKLSVVWSRTTPGTYPELPRCPLSPVWVTCVMCHCSGDHVRITKIVVVIKLFIIQLNSNNIFINPTLFHCRYVSAILSNCEKFKCQLKKIRINE